MRSGERLGRCLLTQVLLACAILAAAYSADLTFVGAFFGVAYGLVYGVAAGLLVWLLLAVSQRPAWWVVTHVITLAGVQFLADLVRPTTTGVAVQVALLALVVTSAPLLFVFEVGERGRRRAVDRAAVMVARHLAWVAAGLLVVALVGGLVFGLVDHPPTAWAAALEVGVLTGCNALPLLVALGLVLTAHRVRRGRRPRRPVALAA